MSTDLQAPSASRNRVVVPLGLVLIGISICLVVIRWNLLLKSPTVAYLAEEQSAPWICRDHPFELGIHSQMRTAAMFQREFKLEQPVASAHLRIRAFRQFSLWLDQDFEKTPPFFRSPANLMEWKNTEEILIPGPLQAGHHVISVYVENQGGPPCLSLESTELDLRTDLSWQICKMDRSRTPVQLASNAPSLALPNSYPTVSESFRSLLPVLVPIFLGAFLVSLLDSRLPLKYKMPPSVIRYQLLLMWCVLCINNVINVRAWLGFDLPGHLEYIEYVANHQRLPLANEGWTMFQSPLFYLIAAPFYSLFGRFFDIETTVRLLRFIPMLCGMLQIEITYRAARQVYSERPDLQTIATVIGGLLPMNVYSSQYVGNEPLAGVLTSLTILYALKLIVEPEQPRKWTYFFVLGAVWGFALLSKATPILLAPLLPLAIGYRGWVGRFPWAQSARHLFTVLGSALVVCGWYYVRNLIYLGRIFVGGWDQHRQVDWWQDPGYRTWTQLSSVGTSVVQPVYSGYWSLPDALYSTLFTDGFLSGVVSPPDKIPWNVPWMETLSWLGLIPFSCMILGGLSCLRQTSSRQRACLVFSSAVVGIYLFAIVDLWIQLPIYSTAKASYMLGAIPCLGILAAWGASPLLRIVWLRAFLHAGLTCWAIVVFVTFFCVKQT